MECEEVLRELSAGAVVAGAVPRNIESHLAACEACRRALTFFAHLDDRLRQQPMWEPPAGFARGIAATAAPAIRSLERHRRTDGISVATWLHGLTLGVVVGTVTCLAGRVFVSWLGPVSQPEGFLAAPPALAAGCAALSLVWSLWIARRAAAGRIG